MDGKAGASSVYDPANPIYDPIHAFVGRAWHSAPYSLPAFIWYNFDQYRFCPAGISFRPAQEISLEKAVARFPTKYQFIGSNDAECNRNSSWTALCEDLSGKAISSKTEKHECRVNLEEQSCRKFGCLGIKVLDVVDRYVVLQNIAMWTCP